MKLNQKLAIRYVRAQLNILALVSPRKAAIKAFKVFCTPPERARKKGSALFEKGESLSFRQDEHTMRGHRWMPAVTPVKKVLIAHGFQSSSRNFEGYITPLLEKGYEVIAFDAPAHGRSGGRRIVLPDYARMLRTVDQNYGPFHAFLGHSLGGLALSLFLENAPHSAFTRLALVAPAVEITTGLTSFGQLLHLPGDVLKEMDEYVQETSGHPFSWYSLRRALHHIEASIFYVQDEEDRITPLRDARLVQQDEHPNIRFSFTRGLGHRRIYKDPEVLSQVVEFL